MIIASGANTLSIEMLAAAGLSGKGILSALLKPFVWPPAHRFSRVAAEFDRRVAESGLIAAARWALPHFVEKARAVGAENIPATGPLVIASNHPGTCDGLVVLSVLPRDDLKIIATGRPFFRRMIASASHLIYTPTETHERMNVIRRSIRHLRSGGALLIFPSGKVEPDPELLPGAEESLQSWSPSLPLLLQRVPESRLLLSIVSGVLAPAALRHPLTYLRKDRQLRQVLAEFIQTSQQMVLGRRFGLTATARFSRPVTAAELGGDRDAKALFAAIAARARELLAEVRPGQGLAFPDPCGAG
jgi:hypothetical protein